MSKWDGIHKKAQEEKSDVKKEVENYSDAINTAEELKEQILEPKGAIDNPDELKAQQENPGPNDTPIEEANTPQLK